MIRTISNAWGIPLSLLTGAYELEADTARFKVPKQRVVAIVRKEAVKTVKKGVARKPEA